MVDVFSVALAEDVGNLLTYFFTLPGEPYSTGLVVLWANHSLYPPLAIPVGEPVVVAKPGDTARDG